MPENDYPTYYIVYGDPESSWVFLGMDKPEVPANSDIWLAPLFPYSSRSFTFTGEMFACALNAASRFENDPLAQLRAPGQVIVVVKNGEEYTGRAQELLDADNCKLLLDESGLIRASDDKMVVSRKCIMRDIRHANFPCFAIDFTEAECERFEFLRFVQPVQIHAHVLEEALDDAGCDFLPELVETPGSIFWSRRANRLALSICEGLFRSPADRDALQELFGCEDWERELNSVWQYVSTPPQQPGSPTRRRMSPVTERIEDVLRIWTSYVLSKANAPDLLEGLGLREAEDALGLASAVDAYLAGVPADFIVGDIERRELR